MTNEEMTYLRTAWKKMNNATKIFSNEECLAVKSAINRLQQPANNAELVERLNYTIHILRDKDTRIVSGLNGQLVDYIDEAIAALSAAPEVASDVLDEVKKERVKQNQQWGGPDHDDMHTELDWFDYINHQIQKGRNSGIEASIDSLIKIAALSFAALESIARKSGKFSHSCHDWDGMMIDNSMDEFESCTCYDKEQPANHSALADEIENKLKEPCTFTPASVERLLEQAAQDLRQQPFDKSRYLMNENTIISDRGSMFEYDGVIKFKRNGMVDWVVLGKENPLWELLIDDWQPYTAPEVLADGWYWVKYIGQLDANPHFYKNGYWLTVEGSRKIKQEDWESVEKIEQPKGGA